MSTVVCNGIRIEVKDGSRLSDALPSFSAFCNGQGTCGACRVRVEPAPPPCKEELSLFSEAQLAAGWRLACRTVVRGPLRVETVAPVRAVEQSSDAPCDGIAIDLGTTTVAVAAVVGGRRVRCVSEPNAQRVIGADVVSRIAYAERENGAQSLRELIRRQLVALCREVDPTYSARRICIAANTVMQHLLLGADVGGLGHAPYTPAFTGTVRTDGGVIAPERIGAELVILPSVSAYVGGDLSVGAALIEERVQGDYLLIDLGTNGELVYRCDGKRTCTSTAAGPAYEGGVSCGSGVGQGAVTAVRVVNGTLALTVEGGGKPLGVCGSGLIGLLYALRLIGRLRADGRLDGEVRLDGIALTQADVRALQTAKAAIRAGIAVLTQGKPVPLYLAGAFGAYLDVRAAVGIGLLPSAAVHTVGNLALEGAVRAVSDPAFVERVERLAAQTESVSLAESEAFGRAFLREMDFPQMEDEI